MAAPSAVISHGPTGALLLSDELIEKLDGLDEGTLEYLVPDRFTFRAGGTPPDFPNLRIQEVRTRPEADEYLATLRVTGLRDTSQRIVSREWSRDPFGWDECQVGIIAKNDVTFSHGTALTGYANMRLMEMGEADRLDGRWLQHSLTYRGIRSTGLVSRKITVNENIVSPSEQIIVGLDGGWETAADATVSLPRIVVTDTEKSTTAPDTQQIPGPLTSPEVDARSFPTIQTFSITGDSLRKQWPNGWKWAAIDSEELYLGAAVYINTYTYEYVWPETW